MKSVWHADTLCTFINDPRSLRLLAFDSYKCFSWPISRTEGDLSENAKLWYQQVDPAILSKFYSSSANEPVKSAEAFVSRVIEVHQSLNSSGVSAASSGNQELREKDEKARNEKWEELVCIMKELEGMHGWKEVDGTRYYTKDEDPSHKSNVLGETGHHFIGL